MHKQDANMLTKIKVANGLRIVTLCSGRSLLLLSQSIADLPPKPFGMWALRP
jgi:hypothetical protein